jgi:carbon storage regulator
MLVLTRKLDESIMLGKDIEIKILAVEDGRVKIGIAAPKSIEIMRKEIYAEVQKENKAAGTPARSLEELNQLFKNTD